MPDLIPIETIGQDSQDKVIQADATQVEQAERTEEQVSETNKCVTIADEVDDGVWFSVYKDFVLIHLTRKKTVYFSTKLLICYVSFHP